jgi:hypothetical protein
VAFGAMFRISSDFKEQAGLYIYFYLKPEEKQAETFYLFFSLKRKHKTLKNNLHMYRKY